MIAVTEPLTSFGAVVLNAGNVSGNFYPDLRRAFRQLATLIGATYVGAPIGTPQPGSVMYLDFTQDGTGSRVITWDPIFRDPPAWGSSGPAGANAAGEFRFTSAGSWQYVGGSSAWAVAAEGMPTAPGAMALGTAAPSVLSGGVVVAPSAGSITGSGVAPSRVVQANTARGPTAGSVSLSGNAPTLSPLSPAAGQIGVAGIVPVMH